MLQQDNSRDRPLKELQTTVVQRVDSRERQSRMQILNSVAHDICYTDYVLVVCL